MSSRSILQRGFEVKVRISGLILSLLSKIYILAGERVGDIESICAEVHDHNMAVLEFVEFGSVESKQLFEIEFSIVNIFSFHHCWIILSNKYNISFFDNFYFNFLVLVELLLLEAVLYLLFQSGHLT
jgi:hypothetical protein